jgi:hypothetical protein
MILDGTPAAIARILFAAALVVAAALTSGCGDYDVGPDPLPWNPPADASPQSPGR